ncbi:hypothetical protein FGO68_gene2376 [Halteria grandinella]|uniref:mRNA guanylyltransferase n=1 Tax=Halteria grandinella TaxID=5974 RepID=A0A8J8SW78_HALGN|nr:hypothetical protein FGO68_gene2376 [Halteria grandinella]
MNTTESQLRQLENEDGESFDKEILKQAIKSFQSAKTGKSFPGAQPISFQQQHVFDIQQSDFIVCEKSDGQRYLLVETMNPSGFFLINRKNQMTQVSPKHSTFFSTESGKFLIMNIFDGELLMDRGSKTPVLLIFDALFVRGQKSVMHLPFTQRLTLAATEVRSRFRRIQIADSLIGAQKQNPHAEIEIYMKDMFRAADVPLIFTHIMPKLIHENDGLILTMNQCPYYPGTCPQILKWKPQELNTIDFQLRLLDGQGHFALLSHAGFDKERQTQVIKFFDYLFPQSKEEQDQLVALYQAANSKGKPLIVECSYDLAFSTPDVALYNQALQVAKETFPNPHPDPLAPSPDALFTIATRDQAVLQAHREYLKAKADGQAADIEDQSLYGGWRYHRVRDDKNESNYITVAMNTFISIFTGLPKEDLISVCEGLREQSVVGGKRSRSGSSDNGGTKRFAH